MRTWSRFGVACGFGARLGRLYNPKLVESQWKGGIIMGIGQACSKRASSIALWRVLTTTRRLLSDECRHPASR